VTVSPTVDVLIAGGGPAGSALATLLRREGHSVLVCDAARFPRHKVCGEYIPPAALSIFAGLGVLDEILSLQPRRHVGMAVISPDGTKVLGRYGGSARGLSLRRFDLDRVLLQGARRRGAMVLEGARVIDLRRSHRGGHDVTIRRRGATETLSARVVVGADGRNSFVARRLGLRRPEPRHRKWAVMAHCRGVLTPDDHGEMIVTPYGYCGVNPLPHGLANVCVVVDRGEIRRAAPAGGVRLSGFFRDRVASHPLTARRMAGATIVAGPWATGPLACRSSRSVGDGVLLVGDAAGFYDPFTGGGIGIALRGAELAAAVLGGALRRGDVGRRALRAYEVLRRRAFRDRLRLDRYLQSLLKHPRLTDWVAGRLLRDPVLADLLAGVTGDTTDAARVLRPGFVARLILA
jgi:geranylgeranyl reductase family protein